MLEGERTAFVGVALQTGLLAIGGGVNHARAVTHTGWDGGGAMRVVAIGARDGAFVNPVLEGHRELSADGGVAAVAEVGLSACEQELRRLRFMYGVAARTGDLRLRVRRAADLRAWKFTRD